MTYQTPGGYLLAWQHDCFLAVIPVEMAADALSVTGAAIEQLIETGELPVINIAGQTYIPTAVLAKSADDLRRVLKKIAAKEKKLVNAAISTLKTAARLRIVVSCDSLRRVIGLPDRPETDAVTLERILGHIHNESQPIYTCFLPVLLRKEASLDAMPPDSLFTFLREIDCPVKDEKAFTDKPRPV